MGVGPRCAYKGYGDSDVLLQHFSVLDRCEKDTAKTHSLIAHVVMRDHHRLQTSYPDSKTSRLPVSRCILASPCPRYAVRPALPVGPNPFQALFAHVPQALTHLWVWATGWAGRGEHW